MFRALACIQIAFPERSLKNLIWRGLLLKLWQGANIEKNNNYFICLGHLQTECNVAEFKDEIGDIDGAAVSVWEHRTKGT